MSLTRRRLVGTGAGLAALGVGLSQFPAFAQSATPDAFPVATPNADGTRTIATIHGDVTVPANPTRIISVNFPSSVTLLELGVAPVGITSYLPILPPSIKKPEGIPAIDDATTGDLNLELIASLKPDLIVGSDWLDPSLQQAPYADLTKIAPTALFEWKQAAGNWPIEAAGCAAAIGKSTELAALKGKYDTHSASIKSTYADVIAQFTWDVISGSDANWYLYGPTSSHGAVAVAAGIRLNAAAKQTDGYVEESFEQLNLLAETDVLLVQQASAEMLNAQATYTALPAVKAKHAFASQYFFPSSYGISDALLDDIETALKSL
ncbi:MAG TPA: ABC transporter substrate-binding protein [Thermomicrobiales bacterium]|nr:ABC transporter substrate-binding protein [Thermomicrobiales bacterium]